MSISNQEQDQILKDALERIYRGGNFPVSEEIIRNKNTAVPKGNWKVSSPKYGHGIY